MNQSLNAGAELEHDQLPAEPTGLPQSGERPTEPSVIEESSATEDTPVVEITPESDAKPEEHEIIATVESLTRHIEHLGRVGSINQAVALEMHRELPGVKLPPVNYFTEHPSRTNLEPTLESLTIQRDTLQAQLEVSPEPELPQSSEGERIEDGEVVESEPGEEHTEAQEPDTVDTGEEGNPPNETPIESEPTTEVPEAEPESEPEIVKTDGRIGSL